MLLFVSGVAMSQADSISKLGNADDSLIHVVPQVSLANVSMITAPEGFEIAQGFNGYIHMGASTAIVMTMIDDIIYTKLAETMTEEYFTRYRLSLVSEAKVFTTSGLNGVIYKLNFKIEDKDFVRYMVYIGDLKKTLWLNITYPKQVEELVESEILKAIQTVNFNNTEK